MGGKAVNWYRILRDVTLKPNFTASGVLKHFNNTAARVRRRTTRVTET